MRQFFKVFSIYMLLLAIAVVLFPLGATAVHAASTTVHGLGTLALLGFAGTTIGTTFPTLLDFAKRIDPNGSTSTVAEVLSKANPILQDMVFQEGNLPTGHRFTARMALPSVTWRKLNQGLDPTKSATDQVDETCGIMEAHSKIDVDLATLNGNEAAFRQSEDMAFVSGMNIEAANGLFYHSTSVNPERFMGLTSRLNATSGNIASGQIVKWGGSSSGNDQTSIWLIGWAPDKVFGIFPKGSKAGLQQEDLGRQLVPDANNKQFLAYVTRFQWKLGLCVRDFRYVVRGCNIDTSAEVATNTYLITQMMDMIAAMYSTEGCKPVFYMNRWTFSMLNKQLMNKQANFLEWLDGSGADQPSKGGARIPAFLGIPIRVVDAITSAESVVS
jgi:hypothetical protein